ncbi:hypothetical protein CHH72_16835, partial [Shouchella clausii]
MVETPFFVPVLFLFKAKMFLFSLCLFLFLFYFAYTQVYLKLQAVLSQDVQHVSFACVQVIFLR